MTQRVDDESNESVEREFPVGRWAVGAVLLVGLIGVVAFALNRSNAEREAQQIEQQRAEAEVERATKAVQGDVNYVVFCATAKPGRAGLDIRDALDQVALTFPAKISFSVVVSVTADRPGRRYEFARFDPLGKVDFAQELKLGGGTDFASVNVVPIKDFELTGPRDVVFRVLRDGETIAERVLRVGEAAARGQPSKPVEAPEEPAPAATRPQP